MGKAQTVGFYPAVNVRNVSPKNDEVGDNKEIAAVGDSNQGALSAQINKEEYIRVETAPAAEWKTRDRSRKQKSRKKNKKRGT